MPWFKAAPSTSTPRPMQSAPGDVALFGGPLGLRHVVLRLAASEARETTGSITGTLRVRTTLEPKLQDIAERVIADTVAKEGAERNASQAALGRRMKPNGAVVAMVGGRDYKESQFNRAVQAQRQPGSAFKLFVYLRPRCATASRPRTRSRTPPLEIDGWET